MARLRVGGLSGDTVPAPTAPRLRIGGLSGDGDPLPTAARLRIGGLSGDGAPAAALEPLVDRTGVEPLSTQTIPTALSPGSAAPDSYTWRNVPTPGATAVTINGTGATVSCRAPAGRTGAFAVLGVRVTKGAYISPERTIRIDTPPHQWWRLTATGLVPCRPPIR